MSDDRTTEVAFNQVMEAYDRFVSRSSLSTSECIDVAERIKEELDMRIEGMQEDLKRAHPRNDVLEEGDE